MSFHQSSHLRCEFRPSDPPTIPFESNETPLYDADPAAPTAPLENVVPPAVETTESVAEELAQVPLSSAPADASIDLSADSTTELIPPVTEVAPKVKKSVVRKKAVAQKKEVAKTDVIKTAPAKKAVTKTPVKKVPVKKSIATKAVAKKSIKRVPVKKPVVPKKAVLKKFVKKAPVKKSVQNKAVALPKRSPRMIQKSPSKSLFKKQMASFFGAALRTAGRRKVKK
eukprot:CAMPEP_0201508502 /NCGR_PEP_ID=MMETSP0161_2-20130828/1859_1 /ASSEMBLY_ACC=CAM_ASM_000251 /TAXON_ID=180227 /ORGANISM="Neoparamoeba aestuarina, Strain SoJaBio B1-5/56/2" /LENGTH=225 /DNA_ID=CAMNT_0047903195 /DNA_START=99 /DNA_END=776 /DNA_ORIENTATION=-